MTLYELVKYLRTSILDDVGGYGIDWSGIDEDSNEATMLRWTNEELTNFINEALRKVALGTHLYRDLQPSFEINIRADIYVYPLDDRIIQIKNTKLVSSGRPLERQEMEDVENITDWEDDKDTPISYIVDYEMGKIAVYPTPTEDDTLKIWAIRTEMNKLEWENAEECSPELPEKYHIPMLNYAAHLAYMKDEPSALDPQASDKFLGRFVHEFDFNSAYVQTRRARNRGRTVKYGGIG